jgi:hypothetical protein
MGFAAPKPADAPAAAAAAAPAAPAAAGPAVGGGRTVIASAPTRAAAPETSYAMSGGQPDRVRLRDEVSVPAASSVAVESRPAAAPAPAPTSSVPAQTSQGPSAMSPGRAAPIATPQPTSMMPVAIVIGVVVVVGIVIGLLFFM